MDTETYIALKAENERLRKENERLRKENERLGKENEDLRREMALTKLRRQVTPHFLFNSINVASSLILHSPKDAVRFLGLVAKMYRYLLKYGNEFHVPIEQELEMMQQYYELMSIRYVGCIVLNINGKVKQLKHHPIPPLALQGLIENAIKHNSHNPEEPLTIDIDTDGHHFIISNEIKPLLSGIESHQLGLNYINQTMQLLFNQEITVINDGNTFTVKIPLV